jgi:hypothetical protein
MTSSHDEHEPSAFERQAHDAFEDSTSHLDAATLSRLNQSRQRALEAAGRRAPVTQRWLTWAPAGAIAAAALVAVLVLRTPAAPDNVATNATPNPSALTTTDTSPDAALDPLTVVAAGDDLELAAEADLDFYAWVELETAGEGIT